MNEEWREAPLGSCYDLIAERFDSRTLPPGSAYFGLEHLDPLSPLATTGGATTDVSGQVTAFRTTDTLFGRLRPYLRKVSYAAVDGYCSTEVLVLRPRQDLVVPRFLQLLASSDRVVGEAVEKSAGSRMPRTSAADLAAILVPLPPLQEQRRIVDLMEHLDNQVSRDSELHTAARRSSTALASHIWNVASAQGAQCDLETASTAVRNGVMYKRGVSVGGIPVTRIQTISDGLVDLSKTGSEGLDEESAGDFLLAAGDILFSNKNSLERVGTTAIVRAEDLPLINGDNLLQIRARPTVDPYYLLALMRSTQMRRRIRSITRPAVNQASVNAKQVKALLMPLLNEEQQASLGQSYRAVLDLEEATQMQVTAVGHLRGSLLSTLLSGAAGIPESYDELLGAAS